MMNHTCRHMIAACAALVTVVPAPAVSPMARLIVRNAAHPLPACSRDEDADTTERRAPFIPLILQISDAGTVDSLAGYGVIVYNRRDDLLLTSIPTDSIDKVLDMEGVIDAATNGSACTCLDMARPFTSTDAVQQGIKLPQGYDGTGVLVGFSDIGFDSKNIAFAGRLAAIYNYDTPQGIRQAVTTAADFEHWTTDTDENWHATHVGNILAGAYTDAPYYGVATGSEIVATTSQLHDVGILAGVEDIIAHAKDTGRRAVINLSLASFLGPHDGTDLMCRYLESCAREAVICISAGNNGKVKGFARKNLAAGDAIVTVNNAATWDGFNVSGYTDIWSDTDAPFLLRISVYDSDSGRMAYTTPWYSPDEPIAIDADSDPEWAQYMSGRILAESGVSPLNGRYNATVMYDTRTEAVSDRGQWSRYFTAIEACHPEDAEGDVWINIFADTSHSILGGLGDTQVSADCSINNMCTARGVISVGNVCSRNEAPILGAEPRHWNVTVGEIDPNSSYSDVPNVERLPNFSAPGTYLISAMSTSYFDKHPDTRVSAVSDVDGRPYYWYAACGTSMASPLAAGIIALWLQACPDLTVDDILDIACSTASRDYSGISDPRWGAGCIDATAGMAEVLRRASHLTPSAPDVRISVTADRRLAATGCDLSEISLYNISGLCIRHDSQLMPGVYIASHPKLGTIKLTVR